MIIPSFLLCFILTISGQEALSDSISCARSHLVLVSYQRYLLNIDYFTSLFGDGTRNDIEINDENMTQLDSIDGDVIESNLLIGAKSNGSNILISNSNHLYENSKNENIIANSQNGNNSENSQILNSSLSSNKHLEEENEDDDISINQNNRTIMEQNSINFCSNSDPQNEYGGNPITQGININIDSLLVSGSLKGGSGTNIHRSCRKRKRSRRDSFGDEESVYNKVKIRRIDVVDGNKCKVGLNGSIDDENDLRGEDDIMNAEDADGDDIRHVDEHIVDDKYLKEFFRKKEEYKLHYKMPMGNMIYQMGSPNVEQIIYYKNFGDYAPVIVFDGRNIGNIRGINGRQSKVCNDIGKCIECKDLYEFQNTVEYIFDDLYDIIASGSDIIIPGSKLDGAEQVIFHDIGKDMLYEFKLYIQYKLDELAMRCNDVHQMEYFKDRRDISGNDTRILRIRFKSSYSKLHNKFNPKRDSGDGNTLGIGKAGSRSEEQEKKAIAYFKDMYDNIGENDIIYWTDGACNQNGNKDKRFSGSGGIFLFGKHPNTMLTISCALGVGTNNRSEAYAIGAGFVYINDDIIDRINVHRNGAENSITLHVCTDSRYCIGILDKNNKLNSNKKIFRWIKDEVKEINKNNINIIYHWVPGHIDRFDVELKWNSAVDAVAVAGRIGSEEHRLYVKQNQRCNINSKSVICNEYDVPRRMNDFVKLCSNLKKEFKNIDINTDIDAMECSINDVDDQNVLGINPVIRDDTISKVHYSKLINHCYQDTICCLNCKKGVGMNDIGLSTERRKYYRKWYCNDCNNRIVFACGVKGCDFESKEDFEDLIDHVNENNSDDKHLNVMEEMGFEFELNFCEFCNMMFKDIDCSNHDHLDGDDIENSDVDIMEDGNTVGCVHEHGVLDQEDEKQLELVIDDITKPISDRFLKICRA